MTGPAGKLLASGILLSATLVSVWNPASAQAPAPAPTFGEPTLASQGNGFEAGIRLDPTSGVQYLHVPGALSSDTSWVWRSFDDGRTFKWVPASVPLNGKFGRCPGGGDTEVAVDSAGHMLFNDLTLVNFSTARSDDQGMTVLSESCAATETSPNDRQWYATDGDVASGGNVYLTYNHFAAGTPVGCPGATITANNQLVLARSPAPGAPASMAGVQFAPSKRITAPCHESIMGNVEVSPITHRIFIPHPNAYQNEMRIARCEAVPFTSDPTGLSCIDKVITTFPHDAPAGCTAAACKGFKSGANFPNLAIDTSGNLFVVWQQAPVENCGVGCLGQGDVTGDTVLYWSSSTDEGDTWTTPVQIPTPGLHNNVLSWAAAGDAGRVDIAWYGTDAVQDPAVRRGPDSTNGLWGVYLTQTLNGTSPTPTFTEPVLASGHHVHRQTMFTVIGRQTGNRALGDFLQMRIGLDGEAIIAYGDSTNRNRRPHAMVVRQNGGSSVFASDPVVDGDPVAVNQTSDPEGDATYEARSQVSLSQANLDIVASSMTMPDPETYRIEMQVADLGSLAPTPSTGNSDTTLNWNTMWLAPSNTDPFGGKNFFAYMESTNGGAPRFFDGENAQQRNGGGLMFTYPGRNAVVGSVSQGGPGQPDTITINVPRSHVSVPDPVDDHLHSVTASTMTLPEPANTVPYESTSALGGTVFNVIDVAAPYRLDPSPEKITCPGMKRLEGRLFIGTNRAEHIVGTPGRDLICGQGGRDVIEGLQGNDVILGGAGRDRITGGGGRDVLKAGRGVDRLNGGAKFDRCHGGPGREQMRRCEEGERGRK